MKYAITYSSITGNTKQLAEIIKENVQKDNLIYFGSHSDEAYEADKIYIGFWTDKGTCDQKTIDFLKKLSNKEVFIFGTAGFGKSQEYFDGILERVKAIIPQSNKITGCFMCQGKMQQSVKNRYLMLKEKDKENSKKYDMLIENFEEALYHPNENDKKMLINSIM